MKKQLLTIDSIPSIIWGDKSDKLFVAIHGNMSNKADEVISIFAEKAVLKGYQVISFDLPEHGDRLNEQYSCTVQNCVHDLKIIMDYAQAETTDISIFACSMGAYFSLLSYNNCQLDQCLFLSPVLDMERIIQNMMLSFGVSENRLEAEKEIATPIGQTLSWDYYSYVKDHPVVFWNKPTSILCGSKEEISEFDVIRAFSDKFNCKLAVFKDGEHYFHTDEQLKYFRFWLQGQIY